jgi:hypothetical protein
MRRFATDGSVIARNIRIFYLYPYHPQNLRLKIDPKNPRASECMLALTEIGALTAPDE